MSTYLDTSALAKLIVTEAESPALRTWLQGHPAVPLMTNTIGAVELRRLAARIGQQATSAAVLLLTRIDLLSLTPGTLAAAAELPLAGGQDARRPAPGLCRRDQRPRRPGHLRPPDAQRAALSYGLVVQSPGS